MVIHPLAANSGRLLPAAVPLAASSPGENMCYNGQ